MFWKNRKIIMVDTGVISLEGQRTLKMWSGIANLDRFSLITKLEIDMLLRSKVNIYQNLMYISQKLKSQWVNQPYLTILTQFLIQINIKMNDHEISLHMKKWKRKQINPTKILIKETKNKWNVNALQNKIKLKIWTEKKIKFHKK